jgi:hypothetical protein
MRTRVARALVVTLLLAATSAAAPPASAQVATSSTSTAAPPSTPLGGLPWSAGTPRAFVATMIDFGYLYLRPRLMLGYGRPHAAWVGLEANPIVSGAGLGGYGGLRAAYGGFDLRVGARGYSAFERTYLLPEDSYERVTVASTVGDNAAYVTVEGELNGSLPLGPGELVGLGSLSYVLGVPDEQRVYEETLRVIVDPPWVWRMRGGYVWFPIEGARHSLGVVLDVVGVPERDAVTVRTGLVLRVVISRALELRGSFVPAVLTPDGIGILGGDFGELGLRWRWATDAE